MQWQRPFSLVSFVVYDGVGIVFTGDLETAGWTELLKSPTFRIDTLVDMLAHAGVRVNLVVGSSKRKLKVA